MAEKPRKDFTIMNKIVTLAILSATTLISCQKNNINNDPIADVPVNITINMALPLYSHLLNEGTFLYWDGGVKGVVVVHYQNDEYYAFDRSCSYQPSTSCAKIEVDSSFMVFRCGTSKNTGFEKCCDSKFFMNGQVLNGPATFGLKQYQVIKTGTELSIKN
jgi:Rieske Fe-S protein